MADRLEQHLVKIEQGLGGDGSLPKNYNQVDKLDWHLTKIEDLIEEGGGGGGGTTVVANPTLEGDEDSLNGIEIDGTKFKVETVPSPTIDDKGKLLSINSSGEYFLDDKLLTTIYFEIPSSAWVSEAHGVFNVKAEVTLANTLIADGSSIEAYFKDIENSAGVVLNSATQNGNALDLVFYANEVKTATVNGILKYIYVAPPTIDPILENNSWAVIKSVCEAGEASNYWSLGDTKTDLGTDGNTRTFRIVDMQGLYGKHVVFEQVELENEYYKISSSTDYFTYENCDMRTTHLPSIMMKYSNQLQDSLTNTTYKVGKYNQSLNPDGVIELTDKIFLPAAKELFTSSTQSTEVERNALTTFQYYVINDNNTSRRKNTIAGQNQAYWTRSPAAGFLTYCQVFGGGEGSTVCTTARPVAPCFSF